MICEEKKGVISFFAWVFGAFGILFLIVLINLEWSYFSLSPFAAIPLNGDTKWYRDFGGRHVLEIQDEDMFFHHIGKSIDKVKEADIVILGGSTTARLNRDLVNHFSEKYGIKIYNMSFIGIRSGDFSLRIIKKWGIKPALWIINSDDQITPFFGHSILLSLGDESRPIDALEHNWLVGYRDVLLRNLRWRLEDIQANGLWVRKEQDVFDANADSASLGGKAGSGVRPRLQYYRNVDDGSVYHDELPGFAALNNPVLHVDRDPNGHVTPAAIDVAREYLKDIGGRAVLILVPHSQGCPQQVQELSAAMGVEAILPPPITSDYTTSDGGGHLDKKGSIAYTIYLLGELEKTKAFNEMLSQKNAAKKISE